MTRFFIVVFSTIANYDNIIHKHSPYFHYCFPKGFRLPYDGALATYIYMYTCGNMPLYVCAFLA